MANLNAGKKKNILVNSDGDAAFIVTVQNYDAGCLSVIAKADEAWAEMGDDAPEFAGYLLQELNEAGYEAEVDGSFDIYDCLD